MKVDAAETFKRLKLKGESDRGRVGLYLDKVLYKEFKRLCDKEDVPVSRVLEDFMRGIVESVREKK